MNKVIITLIILLFTTISANCYTVFIQTRTIPNYGYRPASSFATCLNNGGGQACYVKKCLNNNGGNACYSTYSNYRNNRGK